MTYAVASAGGMGKREAARFQREIRQGLEASEKRKHKAKIQKLSEEQRAARVAAQEKADEQRQQCRAELDLVREKAEKAQEDARALATRKRTERKALEKARCDRGHRSGDKAACLKSYRSTAKALDAAWSEALRLAREAKAKAVKAKAAECAYETARIKGEGQAEAEEKRKARETEQDYEAEIKRFGRSASHAQQQGKAVRRLAREAATARARAAGESEAEAKQKGREAARQTSAGKSAAASKRQAEKRSEALEAVEVNLEPELVPLWRKVRRRKWGTDRKTATEAFLQYAEENPGEVYEAQQEDADRELARMQAEALAELEAGDAEEDPAEAWHGDEGGELAGEAEPWDFPAAALEAEEAEPWAVDEEPESGVRLLEEQPAAGGALVLYGAPGGLLHRTKHRELARALEAHGLEVGALGDEGDQADEPDEPDELLGEIIGTTYTPRKRRTMARRRPAAMTPTEALGCGLLVVGGAAAAVRLDQAVTVRPLGVSPSVYAFGASVAVAVAARHYRKPRIARAAASVAVGLGAGMVVQALARRVA